MSSTTDSKVGKYKMSVRASKESGPKVQDRIEAIANWLLKQWKNSKKKEQS